jgi:hypothetical protein
VTVARQTIEEIELEKCRLRIVGRDEFSILSPFQLFPLEPDKFKLIIALSHEKHLELSPHLRRQIFPTSEFSPPFG